MTITAKSAAEKKERVDKAMDNYRKPGGTLKHIRIHPAENGLTVEVQRGEGPSTNSVFAGDKAKQDALDHVSNHMD